MPGPCTGAEELFEAGSQTTAGSCQQIPGSPDADILRAIGLLGSLAGYLATAWKRLFEAEGAAQLQLRESKLVRQEMAQMLLRGDIDESEQLREIARSLGFATYPNRIVVVAPSREEPHGLESFSRNIELDSLQRAIEELVKKDRNILVARVHRKCVCIFFAEITGSDGSRNDEKVLAMAKRVVHSIYKTCNLRVRAGIGRATADWRTIVNSYQEAWVALRYSDASVAAFEPTVSSVDSQFDHLAAICDPLMRNDREQLRSVMHSTFVTAARTLVNIEGNIAPLRQFLLVVVGGVLATSRTLDQDKIFLESWSREMCRALDAAGNVHELGELWSRSADRLLVELGRVSSGKHLKLTNLAQTYIHRNIYSHHGARPVVMEEVAALLGVSVGHLSRIFKRTAGITFERYVMEKRIERAQKLLLDPVSRVSEVADKCDFCNPAYFARTFRQIVGCSPSEFSRHPSLYQVAK